MQVDGVALIKARLRIRAEHPGRGKPGKPAKGTQEWLAEQAGISLRALQYLEKGEGSAENLKWVCTVLNIPVWESLIFNQGSEYVDCTAQRFIDFRPSLYPPHHPDSFLNSSLQVTLDPLSILVSKGKFDAILLKEVKGTLHGLPNPIPLTWLAEVLLTPNGQGWLGWVREVEAMTLPANNTTVNIPIMFRQLAVPPVSWGGFVSSVEKTKTSQLNLEVCLDFQNFTKEFTVYISTDLLKILFADGRKKYSSPYPYRAQLKTIV